MQDRVNQVQNLYDTVFMPMLDRAKDLAQAREYNQACRDQHLLCHVDEVAPQKALEAARARFYFVYDTNNASYGPLAKNLHDFLMPGDATSVLAAKGTVLMDNNRYLTAKQSLDLRDLYTSIADQEALAVWMASERYRGFEPRPTARSPATTSSGRPPRSGTSPR